MRFSTNTFQALMNALNFFLKKEYESKFRRTYFLMKEKKNCFYDLGSSENFFPRTKR